MAVAITGRDQTDAKGDKADLRSFRDESSNEQRLLTETKDALDKELPAVQKLAELLRTKAGSLCSSTVP